MTEPARTVAQATARNIRFQGRAVRILAVIGLVAAGLITLLLIGVDVGPVAFATGLVLATVPVPIYVFLALRIDRFEPEPLRLLAWAFFWGASAAVFIALVLNTAGQLVVGNEFGSDIGELYGGSISAPVVEESAKGFVLFLIYRWRRWRLDGVLDGMVYAAMVGLGFAMTENVLYYSKAAVNGGVPLAATFFMRGVLSPFTHPVFTCMTGIGFGLAVQTDRRWVRIAAPVAGLLCAMALHSAWNTSATVGDGAAFVGVYFLIMVPLFFGLVSVALVATSREGRIVARYLAPEVEAGVLSAGDVELLSSLRDRRRVRKAARRDGGTARRAMKTFQLAATDLAFQRHRAKRGLPAAATDPDAAQRRFVEAVHALAGEVGPQVQRLRGEAEQRVAWRAAYAAQGAAGSTAAGRGVAGSTAAGQGVVGSTAAGRGVVGPAGATSARPPAPPRAHPSAPPRAHPPAPPRALPPPGWYGDPWGHARLRWWDGRAWTGYTA